VVLLQPLALATFTAVACAGLVVGEAFAPRARLFVKPLASLGFVSTALALQVHLLPHGGWLLAALIACAIGDLLLLPEKQPAAFVAGMLAFGVGHALFAVVFFGLGAGWWTLVGAALMAPVPWLVWRRLAQHLGRLREPVRGYMGIITVMVASALGLVLAAPSQRTALLAVAAVLFFVSDLFVARHRFVQRAWVNRAVGLPLYYGAQLLFAYAFARGAA